MNRFSRTWPRERAAARLMSRRHATPAWTIRAIVPTMTAGGRDRHSTVSP
ncbi:hypothetical protein P355_4340 [Burkholderia cenocepacia KC-01]|nr:hypothetical protein P355_4340 [Burkholderia cenocepacia KC-01]